MQHPAGNIENYFVARVIFPAVMGLAVRAFGCDTGLRGCAAGGTRSDGLASGRTTTVGLCTGVSGVEVVGSFGFSETGAGVQTTAGGRVTDGNAGGTWETEGCEGSEVEGSVVGGTDEGTGVDGTDGDDFWGADGAG